MYEFAYLQRIIDSSWVIIVYISKMLLILNDIDELETTLFTEPDLKVVLWQWSVD